MFLFFLLFEDYTWQCSGFTFAKLCALHSGITLVKSGRGDLGTVCGAQESNSGWPKAKQVPYSCTTDLAPLLRFFWLCLFLRGGILSGAEVVLLAQFWEITPGVAWGTIWGAGARQVYGSSCPSIEFFISPPLGFLFVLSLHITVFSFVNSQNLFSFESVKYTWGVSVVILRGYRASHRQSLLGYFLTQAVDFCVASRCVFCHWGGSPFSSLPCALQGAEWVYSGLPVLSQWLYANCGAWFWHSLWFTGLLTMPVWPCLSSGFDVGCVACGRAFLWARWRGRETVLRGFEAWIWACGAARCLEAAETRGLE